MDIIHIFGIAILLVGGVNSLNGDTKTDNSQQWILLRKLQNFEETKPLTWNEILADVLVNKIGIFSFKSQDKEKVIKDDAPVPKEKSFLTDFFSNVLVVYKKFIYDAFVGKRKGNDDKSIVETAPMNPKDDFIHPKFDPEEVIRPTQVAFTNGPKSEVELVEPKYHGKLIDDSTTEETDKNVKPGNSKENTDLNDKNPNAKDNSDVPNIDLTKDESVNSCAEGFVKNENGDCVNNNARLILAIPNQCPIGYRKDWLGYCRKIWRI